MVGRPEAVLFDLDGTLIDSTQAIVESFFHTFDTLGRPRPAREAIIAAIGHLLEDQFRRFWPGCDAALCARVYREHYAKAACAGTFLLPGAREILDALRAAGLRLGFATSKRRLYAEMILEDQRVLDYFAARIGPDDVTHAKPHPEAILRAAADLNAAPAATYVVGDTPFDVLAARAAGAPCLCVTTGPATRTELEALGPEAVYDDLEGVALHILARCGPARRS